MRLRRRRVEEIPLALRRPALMPPGWQLLLPGASARAGKVPVRGPGAVVDVVRPAARTVHQRFPAGRQQPPVPAAALAVAALVAVPSHDKGGTAHIRCPPSPPLSDGRIEHTLFKVQRGGAEQTAVRTPGRAPPRCAAGRRRAAAAAAAPPPAPSSGCCPHRTRRRRRRRRRRLIHHSPR